MNERDQFRKIFFDSWKKYSTKIPLDDLETKIIEIILQHPEYHPLLSDEENFSEKNFGDENPFLHLSLHLALREQIATDRPKGIREIFSQLIRKNNNKLEAEHSMIKILEEILWQAQQSGKLLGEEEYLEKLKGLA
jgi:hypothetical protein